MVLKFLMRPKDISYLLYIRIRNARITRAFACLCLYRDKQWYILTQQSDLSFNHVSIYACKFALSYRNSIIQGWNLCIKLSSNV